MGKREDDVDQVDEATILEAYCLAQLAELPHGSRGLKAAQELLTAIPAAYRLGWADTTASAPELFRLLKNEDLISRCPTGSDLPAALRLVASVCGLVTQRSARRWTVWISRACDPDHKLGASIRKAVTPAMLRRATRTPPQRKSVRNEREQITEDLGTANELADLKREYARVTQERDLLARELRDMKAAVSAVLQEIAQLRPLLNRTKQLHNVVAKIRQVFEIAPFAEDEPDVFVDDVSRLYADAKSQAQHIGKVCAHDLDLSFLRFFRAFAELRMLRQGHTLAEADELFELFPADLQGLRHCHYETSRAA